MPQGYPKMRFEELDISWLKKSYYEDKKSSIDIAKELGISKSTVVLWMKRLNFPRRSASESKKVAWESGKISRVYTEERCRNISESLKKNCVLPEPRYGPDHHWWKGGPKTQFCIVCGTETTHRYDERKFCSRKCHDYYRSQGGENGANWRGGPLTHICEVCDKSFMDYREEAKTCSNECFRIRQSAISQGISIDEWDGFISFLPYCSKFNKQKREEIRNQYNRTCVVSGISVLQNGQRLSVDHANENKMQGCNGIKWLLVPLSHKVHAKMNGLQNHLLLELLLLRNKNAEMNYEF